MKLDESLFEDYDEIVDMEEDEEEYSDSEQAQVEGEILADLENKIANLQVGDEEIVITMRTPVFGLTDEGFDTLHIEKRTPDWYHIWNEDKEGNIANEMNFSSFDNTLYWATLASQGHSSGEEFYEEDEDEDVEVETKEEEVVEESLQETTTSRLHQHLTSDKDWAIISPYKEDLTKEENEARMNELRITIRNKLGLGYIQLLSKWSYKDRQGRLVSSDEQSLLVLGMTEKQAMKYGEEYQQSSVIVNNNEGCREICVTPFEGFNKGDIVRTYNLRGKHPLNIADAEEIFANRNAGPVSKAIKGGKPFHLSEVYEVNLPRASYFQTTPSYTKVYEAIEEIVDDDVKVVVDGDLEPNNETLEEDRANAYKNQLIEMINGEWETIQDYNDLVNMLRDVEEYKEYIPVIEGIIKDEHNHIGNLQNVLDKLNPQSNQDIEDGDKEAQDILDKEGE